ncbi:retrovirus-related Pol polyprotein from transposon 17.6 [Trichonephila clavipes]|nr:retrovirus-related Pol polyprotein from transposon 17.6 [Trichonephila clavipes]
MGFKDFEFKASERWVKKFIKGHKIRQRKITKYVLQKETSTLEEILKSAETFRIQTLHLMPKFDKDFVINTDQIDTWGCCKQQLLKEGADDVTDPTHSNLTEYDDIATVLISRFERTVPLSTRLQLFSSFIQGSSESVQEFAARINKLGTQIFQSSNSAQNTATRNANYQLLQSRFISGLQNDIHKIVLARDPNNLEESINAALIEEQNVKLNQIANDERTGLSPLHLEISVISALINKLDEINLEVERLQEASSVTARKTDRHKTAFSNPDGDKYEFNRLCFGLKNSPKAFQSIAQEVLGDLLHNGALVYIDDVILFTKTIDEHFELLVTPERILIDKDKSVSINDFPVPTDQKQIKSFLGCCNFYRRYIKNFAKRALPLTNLLRKDTPFEWTSETQEAFDDIKEAILNPPFLVLPDPNAELQITTDASSRGIGKVLE